MQTIEIESPVERVPEAAPAVVPKKCEIDKVLDRHFHELVKVAPVNPMVLGWMLRITGKTPPANLTTYEQVKEWFEANVEKRIVPEVRASRGARGGSEAFSIDVSVSERESGSASYSVYRTSSDSYSVTVEELEEMIQGAMDDGDDMGEVVRKIDEAVSESDVGHDVDDWNYGDYEYNDHESSDSDGTDREWSKNEIRNSLRYWITNNNPEAARYFGL